MNHQIRPAACALLALLLPLPGAASPSRAQAPAPPTPSAAKEVRSRDTARRFLTQAASLASQIRKPEDRADRFAQIAVAQAKAGDADDAKRNFATARDLARHLPRREDRDLCSLFILRQLLDAGDLPGAGELATSLRDASVQGEARLLIAEARADGRDFAGAKAMAHRASRPADKTYLLATIAIRQAKTGDLPGAKETLAAARQSFAAVAKTDDRLPVLSRVAEAIARIGNAAEAQRLAWSAQSAAPYSAVLALCTVARVQFSAGDAASAGQTLALAQKAAVACKDPDSRRDAMFTIARLRAVTGDREGMRRFVLLIPAADRADAFIRAALSQVRVGKSDAARETLADARREVDRITNAQKKAFLLMEYTSALAEAGDTAAAKANAVKIADPGDRSSVLRNIGLLEAQAGKRAAARETLALARRATSAIKLEMDRAPALRDIAKAQARAGDCAVARQTADTIALAQSWAKWDAIAGIAVEQARAGDAAGAEQTIKTLPKAEDRIPALTDCARALLNPKFDKPSVVDDP